MSSRLFCVDCLLTDGDICFYPGLSNYATSMAIFEYQNPGDSCENISTRGSVRESLKIFIIQTLMLRAMLRLQRKEVAENLRFFYGALCSKKGALRKKHLAHLYGVASVL